VERGEGEEDIRERIIVKKKTIRIEIKREKEKIKRN
jgi:hypothetical protein